MNIHPPEFLCQNFYPLYHAVSPEALSFARYDNFRISVEIEIFISTRATSLFVTLSTAGAYFKDIVIAEPIQFIEGGCLRNKSRWAASFISNPAISSPLCRELLVGNPFFFDILYLFDQTLVLTMRILSFVVAV